nr:reverse transcriptase domain, reverse transcriptase zinc-binding domain protein [Tanacetum cinerariifolium]
EWSKENAKSLMCILKCFEEVFDLRVNYNKSKLYGIGVNEREMSDMARCMGCVIGEFSFTYLGLPIGENMRRVRPVGSRVWMDIIKIGEEIDDVGIELCSSYVGVLGDERDNGFWFDRWVDNYRLCDRFPRLFHLDRRKEGSVRDKGSWVNNVWCWEWEWVKIINGRVNSEFEEFLGVMQNIVVDRNCRDKWRWKLGEYGEFAVKELVKFVEEKVFRVESGGRGTLWNKLVPKKVNIFVWRELRGRLPVRVELDKREVDLDSVLCPCCNDRVEICAHGFVTCDLAMSVWVKVFNWWKVGIVYAFTIEDMYSLSGGINVPGSLSRVWQAVVWTSGYFIWKERNGHAFGKKVSSTNKIVKDIQLKSSEWITKRSNKYKVIDSQHWLWDPQKNWLGEA